MDNDEDIDENNESINSFSSTLFSEDNTARNSDNYLGDNTDNEDNISNNTGKGSDLFRLQKTFINPPPNLKQRYRNCIQKKTEPLCQIELDALVKLKDSTKKLLCLLEEIQAKTHTKTSYVTDYHLTNLIRPLKNSNDLPSVTDIIGAKALKKLESQTKTLESIYIEEEDDDCTVYKKLTRKCNCLTQNEYNDFIIHFNDDIKYFTSTTGEIIKNMRILKKFVYMGGEYSKHALMFLNEGLTDSSHTEKVEITQGCSYADMCNVFEDHSIVIVCISWPCKSVYYGDNTTQNLTAGFLYKLAQLEEGRRYLKFSSKITNDIKKVLRKKASKIEFDTLESLNATLNLMHPPIKQNVNVTYYCKPVDEGYGNKAVNALVQYRKYMTLGEVFTHLDLLHNLSVNHNGQKELILFLPSLLNLFKHLLMEYDNSEMNIIITNILNNVVTKSMIKENEIDFPKTVVMADTATEAIIMKNETVQMPPKKSMKKGNNKSKISMGLSPNKFRQHPSRKNWEISPSLNRSRKFAKELRNPVIVVPIDNK